VDVITLVFLRASSFHKMEKLIHSYSFDMKIYWFLELAGIGIVFRGYALDS